MKMYYISHPYTGNGSVESMRRNRAKAALVTRQLAARFPDIVFINPLETFRHLADIGAIDYDAIIRQCCELVTRCDGIIMCGKWQKSRGCNIERKAAIKRWLAVYPNVDIFIAAMESAEEAIKTLAVS